MHFDQEDIGELVAFKGDGLNTLFKGIPQRITAINLSNNELNIYPASELVQAFSSLHSNISTMDLSRNVLPRKESDLATFFGKLPANLTSLCLNTCLKKRDANQELHVAFKEIPRSVTKLKLKENRLNDLRDNLVLAFKNLPPNLTSLDLGCNSLGECNSDQIAQAFGTLSLNMTSLDLCYNKLGSLSPKDLVKVLAECPKNNIT